MALLEVEKVEAGYGHIVALHGISLRVDAGEIVTLIGPNGAGKTTLLRVISGLLPARSGRVAFDGRDVTGQPAEALVGMGLSHVPEHRQIFGALTVWDNLMLGAFTRRRNGKQERQRDLDFIFDLFPRLAERRLQLAGTLSGGEQQMLAIGRALMARPRLLLLDEPSLGLAPLLVRELFRVIGELRERGVTILLVEQNARAALGIADRGYVLETGTIVLSGAAATLQANPQVQQSYLGRAKRAS